MLLKLRSYKYLDGIILFICFLLFVVLPLSFTSFDNWDGVVIDYAIRTQNYSGLTNWWKEGAYHSFHIWTLFIGALNLLFSANITRIIQTSLPFLLLSISLCNLIRSFSRDKSIHPTLVSLIILITLSPFAYSSIFAPLFFALSLSIYGITLILNKSMIKMFIGFIFTLAGMSYFHAIPFVILCSGYAFAIRVVEKQKSTFRSFIQFICASSFISILFILAYKFIWKSHGLYKSYSSMNMNYSLLFVNIKNSFVNYPVLLPLLFITVSMFCLLIKKRKTIPTQETHEITLVILIFISILANLLLFSINGRNIPFFKFRYFHYIQSHINLRYLVPFFISAVLLLFFSINTISKNYCSKIKWIYLLALPFCITFSVQKWRYNYIADKLKVDAINEFKKYDFSNKEFCYLKKTSSIYKYGANYKVNYLHYLSGNGLPGNTCLEGKTEQCKKTFIGFCESAYVKQYAQKYIFSLEFCPKIKQQQKITPCLLRK